MSLPTESQESIGQRLMMLNETQSNLEENDASEKENAIVDSDAESSFNTTDSSKQDKQVKNSKMKNVKNIPFPSQLHDILSNKSHSDIITWLPNGKSFTVLDKKKFVEVVSPKYFKETKYESFTRKLNRWNFVRISKGPDTGAFHHQYFLRDNVSISSKIRCQKKHERKKPRPCLLKKKDQEAKEKSSTCMNDFPTSIPSSSSLTLEAIKKAQMEQVQRRCLLNYLSLKQQYEQRLNRETFFKSQLPYSQQLKAQVLNNAFQNQKMIQSVPDNRLDFSHLLQKQLQKKVSPIALPKNTSVPMLPRMLSMTENDECKEPQSDANVNGHESEPEDLSSNLSELKLASISKTPAISFNQLQPNHEGDKLSSTRMSYPLKDCDYSNTKLKGYDYTKCNLPPKKKIKNRLSGDENNISIYSYSRSSKSKEEINPMSATWASAA